MKTHIETERRYLIEVADAVLEKCSKAEIVQTYLLSSEGAERVRSWTENGTRYTHTIKKGAGISRIEMEEEIREDEYRELLRRADPDRKPIVKSRYRLFRDGLCFEIDAYPEWSLQKLLEIELMHEDQDFSMPEEFRILREITGEESYSNYAMSLQMPPEE